MGIEEKIPFKISAVRQGGRAVVRITGQIGWETDANAFRTECDQLLDAGAKDVHVYINSPGGSVFDANEIVNILSAFTGKRTGEGGALVASAGTFIAMHLDSFTMPANGRFMIHKPSGVSYGDAGKIKNYAKLLEGLERDYFEAYMAKATSPEEFRQKWDSGYDWWMTAQEALEAGFITAVRGKVAIDRESAMMIAACADSNSRQINHQNNNHMDFLKMTAAALGLPENAAGSDVLKQIIQTADKNRTLTETNAALTAERDALKTENDTLKAATATVEKDSLLAAAVADKRITAKEKDAFAKLDVADVKALLAERKAPVNPMTFITGGHAAPEGSDKWTFAEWTKNSPEGLATMKANDPERYKTLFAAQYGTN
jgi:ATP-dependent protease ClpP protease subunit